MRENASAELLTDMAAALFAPAQGDAEGNSDPYADFAAVISEMHENFHPGTAAPSAQAGLFYAAGHV